MEEINSKNVELSKYQLYCDRVNLYIKNIIELKEKCKTILNLLDLYLRQTHSLIFYNDLKDYINNIINLFQIIEIETIDNISYSKWFSLSDHEDLYIKYLKKIDNFHKKPNVYNIYRSHFREE